MRVLIADKLSPIVSQRLEAAGCAVTADPALKEEAFRLALSQHNPQVVVVRSTKITAAHIDAAPALSLIIRGGAGVNTIDVNHAASRGIYVANCPGKNAVAVAELTMGLLINLDRRISDNVAALRKGTWAKKEFGKARGLKGRTLCILGLGQIGREVVSRAQAFGMHVRVWSRSLTPEQADALGVEYAASPRLAASGANALTVHVALTPQTRGLVGPEVLEALAPGAYVINAARGGVVDETALVHAITTRGLRAGLDVFEDEPSASDTAFTSAIGANPGVYGTHHIGASTDQASEAVGDEVARIVASWKDTGAVPNCVNLAQASLATHLLVVRHRDEVGVLAGVLDTLSRGQINVQEMQNIVFQGSAAACAHIHVSHRPSPALIEELQAQSFVLAVDVVELEKK